MNIVIFDLDNTLVNTEACKLYLRTRAGRKKILELIESNQIHIPLYDMRLPDYVNSLVDRADALVLVVSDSPKDYCVSVLRHHGIRIDESSVYGNQHKPCIDVEGLSDDLELFYDIDFKSAKKLVIGDNAKDIYFANEISSPCIFATWGTKFDVEHIKRWSKPEAVASNLDELAEYIIKFWEGELPFEPYDYDSDYLTVDPATVERHEFSEVDMGFGREYIPDYQSFRNKQDEYTWYDVQRCFKKAKELPPQSLDANHAVLFFSADGKIIPGGKLKSKAGHYLKDFNKWAKQVGLKGKVALVPLPSSLPRECNHSSAVSQICGWWSAWISNNRMLSYDAVCVDCLERFLPTRPAHLTDGMRQMDPHLATVGVFEEEEIREDIDAVVLIDDVITSGSQLNAAATIVNHHGLFPKADLYAFALVRTTHPSPFEGFTVQDIIAMFNTTERQGE